MTDLSRSLLSAARDGMQPDAATMARVRAKVVAIAAAPLASAISAPAQVAVPSPTVVPAAAKRSPIVAGVSILVLVGIAAIVIVGRGQVASPSAPGIEIAGRTELAEPAGAHVVATAPIAAPPASHVLVSTSERHGSAPIPATLAREVELVDRAMVHLRRGAPDEALAELALYRRETRGAGQLAEDAAAIDIEARCRLGRDVAEILAAFDRRWPTSAQRARLSDVCAR